MIFSGFFEERTCVDCGDIAAQVTPTSTMLFVLLAIGGLAVIMGAHGVILEPHWWHWPIGFVGELALALILLGVILGLRNTLAPLPEDCSNCSDPMVPTTRSFFGFAIMPSSSEVVLVLVFLSLHVAFLAWLTPGERMATGSLWNFLPFFWTPPRNAPALSPENW